MDDNNIVEIDRVKNNIRYVSGSIFDSTADCIVNPVNTVGVMGKGLALEFKRRYPSMFEQYKKCCDANELKIGMLMFYKHKRSTNKIICLFPTKEHWKHPSDIDYIKHGLHAFVKFYKYSDIKSVAFPKLGCGLGGLNWEHEVKPLMEKYLRDLDIEIEIYV